MTTLTFSGSRSLFTSLLVAAACVAGATSALADSNYYMGGTYEATLSSGGSFLSCRSRPNVRSAEKYRFEKGEYLEVVDVVGSSAPWLKTDKGCYVRGHANFVTKVGEVLPPQDGQ